MAKGSALRGASLLIALQLASRLLTFAANQALLRFLNAPLLGFAARLEGFYLAVVFFAREAARVAVQRQSVSAGGSDGGDGTGKGKGEGKDGGSARQGQAVVNLSYIPPVLGLLVAFVLGHLMRSDSSAQSDVSFNAALAYYALAATLELLSEPSFALAQLSLRFGTRAAGEALAGVARCAVTLGSAWAASQRGEVGVLPFAYGQVAFGAVVFAWYSVAGWGIATDGGFSILPRQIGRGGKRRDAEKKKGETADGGDYFLGYFYKPTLRLAGTMTAQSIVKHFLTQGDTFLVSILSTPRAQGVYALAGNYGGLIARLLFQPVEESSRAYFSRLLSEPSRAAVTRARGDLHRLLRVYLLLSVPVVTLAPLFAEPLLGIVAGGRWAGEAGAALRAYCAYIPLLALNGVLEAFVSSVATEAQVRRQAGFMTGCSAMFGAAAWLSLRVLPVEPAVGLVLANGVNMLCRIVWCAWFIGGYFREKGVGFDGVGVVPGGLAVGVCVAGRWVTGRGVEIWGGKGAFMDVVVMGALAVPIAALL